MVLSGGFNKSKLDGVKALKLKTLQLSDINSSFIRYTVDATEYGKLTEYLTSVSKNYYRPPEYKWWQIWKKIKSHFEGL